jgi:hypothetical protein
MANVSPVTTAGPVMVVANVPRVLIATLIVWIVFPATLAPNVWVFAPAVAKTSVQITGSAMMASMAKVFVHAIMT